MVIRGGYSQDLVDNRSSIDLLLRNGADPTITDNEGRTAQDYADESKDLIFEYSVLSDRLMEGTANSNRIVN